MFIGIEIGGTKLQIVAGTASGEIVDRRRFTVDREAAAEGIRQSIATALPPLMAAHRIQAIGIGFGGPVDWRTGKICCSHQISGWHEFELGAWAAKVSGLPVYVDNDANVAALGEALKGAGRGLDPVFWINLGSGVGGGLVVDGKLYHGAVPGETEIGHLRLDKSGITVEEKCSGWAIDKRIREAVAIQGAGRLAELVGNTVGGETHHLARAVADHDPLAQAILSELADNLGFALSHVVQLLHPQVIVIGGGVSLMGEVLRDAVATALPRYVMESFQPGPKVALAGLREDSVPVGALLLAAQRSGL